MISILLMVSCQYLPQETKKPEVLIASVYDKNLYLSDLSGMFSPNSTQEDSAQIISSFINRWTLEQVFLTEAAKHIPKDLAIDDLLNKYRESLISLNFQQQLIQENLDSLISEKDLLDFYEKNKDQYQLETSIIRCYLIKVPNDIKEMKQLREYWDDLDQNNIKRLVRIVEKYNGSYHLADSVWHKVEDIEALFPKNRISPRNWTKGESLSFSDGKILYLFKVLELVSKQESAPLSYVTPKAKLVILNKRKNKLIEEFKTKLYETELRKNNVKIEYKH